MAWKDEFAPRDRNRQGRDQRIPMKVDEDGKLVPLDPSEQNEARPPAAPPFELDSFLWDNFN